MTQGRYADAEPLGKLALAIWEKAPAEPMDIVFGRIPALLPAAYSI
jgi:hypothetical protein